jgi:hypothetical protein
MDKEKLNAIYVQTINQIDDLFEYRWEGLCPSEIKSEVNEILEDMTNKICQLKG